MNFFFYRKMSSIVHWHCSISLKIQLHIASPVLCRIRYLLLARMLRLIRLLMHVKQYRGFVATFLTLIPSLMPYLGIIFCVLCIYCSLGVQVNEMLLLVDHFLFLTQINKSNYGFIFPVPWQWFSSLFLILVTITFRLSLNL